MTDSDTQRRERYQRPDGTPKRTGAALAAGVARVRIDETQAPNDRVAIHVEHPDHDGGVRCFYRSPAHSAVARSIRSHLRTELDSDLGRVDVIDAAGIGLSECDLLPDTMRYATDPPQVEVTA